MRKLKKTEKPVMDFFASLGTLISPYAYSESGTTYWHYEVVKKDETPHARFLPAGYEARSMNEFCFFYKFENIIEKIPMMKSLDAEIVSLATANPTGLMEADAILSPPMTDFQYSGNQNLADACEKALAENFDIRIFLARISILTDIWDPMERRSEGIQLPYYFHDYCSYGFGLWKFRKLEE